jgi:superfamily I DNA/RNA helicase
MKSLAELEEYIEKTEDVQLAMMVEIVKEYGNEIPGIIKSLKDLHTGDEERAKAEMIFSTVHRAKGMEYDVVHLVDDFVTEAKLEKLKAEGKAESLNITKWNEEINLLYVAVTRTKNKLFIPETLIPADFAPAPHIHTVKVKKEDDSKGNYSPINKSSFSKQIPGGKKANRAHRKEKPYTVSPKRELHKDANQPWTRELDNALKEMYDSRASVSRMAEHFGRTKGAIFSRLRKLDYFSG